MRGLKSPVLVLNKSWAPLGTTTVRRALVAMFRGVAAGLCVESFQLHNWKTWVDQKNPPKSGGDIKLVDGTAPAPEVIVLTGYDRMHIIQPIFDNRNLYIRDGYRCQYCKKRFNSDDLTIDHVMPKSRGGATDWANCVTACVPCNSRKANRTPKEARMPLLTEPGRLKWDPILRISQVHRPASWNQLLGRTG